MAKSVRIAFDPKVIELSVSSILPTRKLPPQVKATVKYQRIAKSIPEVGVIEPLSVFPQAGTNHYILLDGHMRFEAQLEHGADTVRCIVAHDDEAFTHNKRRRTMLDGICPEVVEMLKDRSVNPTTFEILRKMKPLRQIEAADLMMTVSNFTMNYAKALLAATQQDDLTHPDRPKKISGMTPEQMARMEREMEAVTRDFKEVEASYGDDVLHLVIATRYLDRLIGNERVAAYLDRHHPEILAEFHSIIGATSLDQGDHTHPDA